MSFNYQLDFNKLYCQFHPFQLVTNYCNDQKCLVGLCATCICFHTDIHAQAGTIPQYQNIKDTFCLLHDQLKNQISFLEDDKCKLGTIRQSIEVKKITIKKTIRQLREETLTQIREEFESIQTKIMADISAQEKRQGYHSKSRVETLDKNLTRETETLLCYIEGLNSQNFLNWAKKLKKQVLMESNQSRLKLQKQLKDNETYNANLKWSPNFSCLFTIEFVIPKLNEEMRNGFTSFRRIDPNITNTSIISRSSSQPKHYQSLMKDSSFSRLRNFAQTSYSMFYDQSQKNVSIPLQKQSLVRKHKFNLSGVSGCDLVGSKENCLDKSCFMNSISQSRLAMVNNLSGIQRPSFQNEKLNYLIQAKKNSQFDNPTIQILERKEGNFRGSGLRMY